MGSSCSSGQKKKEKEKQSQGGQSPIGGRRRSTDSLPYGKGSPPSSRRHSFDPGAGAQQSLSEQAETPDDNKVAKGTVDPAVRQTSVGGTCSPPSTGVTSSPVVKEAPGDVSGLPDLKKFPERVCSLLMGRVMDVDGQPPLQEVSLYICADFYDSAVERNALMEEVYPGLRRYTAERGYELNVVDFHWGVPGNCLVDHTYRDVCLEGMDEKKRRDRLLTLVLFNDNLGPPDLPRAINKALFNIFMDGVEADDDKDLLRKWYELDENITPVSFVLRSISSHIPNITSDQAEERREAQEQWMEEAKKMVQLLKGAMDDKQRSKYLFTVLEKEIEYIVADDPQLAKRCLWMQRRFTHLRPSGEGPIHEARDPQDSKRIDRSKVLLEDYLPDTQKLVFYVKWHQGGLDPVNVQEHARYLREVCDGVRDELKKMIDGILEEDFLDEAQQPYKGIENALYVELIQQSIACQLHVIRFKGRTEIIQSVKDYLEGTSSSPLIIHGPPGCGKTALISKVVEQCADWLPTAPTVIRTVNVTAESTTQEQLLRSICEQCCALYGEHPSLASESFQGLGARFGILLEKVSSERPLVIIIDGLDQVVSYSSRELKWLPRELPDNVKLIITVRDESKEYEEIKGLLEGDDCYLAVAQPVPADSVAIVKDAVKKGARRLTEAQRQLVESCLEEAQNAHYANLLSQMALQWQSSEDPDSLSLKASVDHLVMHKLTLLEGCVSATVLTIVLGLLLAAKHGLSDSEMVDVLSCDESALNRVFNDESPAVRRFPSVVWGFVKRRLWPFVRTRTVGGRSLTTIGGDIFRGVCTKYLKERDAEDRAGQALKDYFYGTWAGEEKKPVGGEDGGETKKRHVLDQPLAYGSNPNRRKLEELPLQCGEPFREHFLFDSTWLLYKFCGSDPYQMLEDLSIYYVQHPEDSELKLLSELVQLSSYALRYDGSQFFSQVYGRLKRFLEDDENCTKYPSIKRIYDTACKPPLSSLLPLGQCLREPTQDSVQTRNDESQLKASPLAGLYTIKDDEAHVISLSPEKGEIIVWNIYEQAPVRTLTGINQPKDVKMIDMHRALVLCNRELKVYHLDEGALSIKLKGVMNQKMAYYGLHDENYVVALSRNRMYVNMMNLTTGDLETTFKVGEDRFLNSLLVSANGRICVCGDETQKPFPLLVWDLGSRKLVYDLRIPHHEFITRLSAISDDGHYVVSVCRELHDTSPNFIIVYDLQSGTLFKKWKPESNSCSIAISSQGGCVVNGLENTWVLVWDLSTGARRFTLRGHTAPVDQIRMDERGTRCLTFDSLGRDRSLRVWDVAKGECLAAFTPDQAFSCCELSLDGKAVVLGLTGHEGITTLLLCRESSIDEELPASTCYGDPERKGEVFDVSQQG